MLNAKTLVAQNAAALLSALSRVPESPLKTLLFALAPSSNVTRNELSALTALLTKRFPTHVGCISAPVLIDSKLHPEHCSVSLALVDGIPFRSTVPGRPEPQVGRWHAGRNRDVSEDGTQMNNASGAKLGSTGSDVFNSALGENGEMDWQKLWSLPSSSNCKVGDALPQDLQCLESSSIGSFIYFSDRALEGITTELQNTFPSSHQLALFASPTPFLTGRPVTLFYNGQVHSDGAVGIALPSSLPSQLDLNFPTLVPLTPALPITSSEGNLILSINSSNPTRLLLSAIQKHGLSLSGDSNRVGKEDAFYIGVIEGGKLSQLYHINSGDPYRGTMALNTDMAPREGALVQMFRLPHPPTGVMVNPSSSHSHKPSVSLVVIPEVDSPPPSPPGPHSVHDTVFLNTFIAASENGFMLSRGNSTTSVPWTCTVPGGKVTLTWN
ncbi:hypothetical protein V8B97DRAFT_1967983 [Scleroderma yunnanense]